MESAAKKKRYALVTGCAQGIGRTIAIELAKDGCAVLLNDKKNNYRLIEVKNLIESIGGEAELLPFDVSKLESVNAALDVWFADHPDEYIDVLVNNAGIAESDLMITMAPDQWHHAIDVSLNGFFYCTRRVIGGMVVNHHGRIVNISSIAAQLGVPKLSHYAAAKAALIGATRSLAIELAPKHITVNAVAPGAIDTNMLRDNIDLSKEIKRIPMQRLGKPEEVASVVSFLCSDKSDYISGQIIGINGGLL